MSLKEMRDELKALRKEKGSVKPISKMKKSEIAVELERLREVRESTPAVVAVKSMPPKKMEPKVADVKEAKEKEFPVAPAAPKKKAGGKKESAPKKETVVGGSGAVGVEPKMSKKDILKKLIEEMDDE